MTTNKKLELVAEFFNSLIWFRNTGNILARLFTTNVLQAVLPKRFWNN
jgi:hypothetical protein